MGKKKLKKKDTKPNYIKDIVGVLVFLISFFTYLKTLTPDVALHDSGELITCAYLLGIPHPPGYPFYCLFGKLTMTILPIGNIAYRMNIASALCASLACLMVYFIVLEISGTGKLSSFNVSIRNSKFKILNWISFIPAVVATLMLAFATTFWEQAVIAEKYTLNALFTTLIIFILLKWQEAVVKYKNPQSAVRNPQFYLYLFALAIGLSFTHHFQTIFLIPASIFLIITILCKNSKLLTLNSILKMLCCFILPLSLYLYLPLSAIFRPEINMGDPQTWERFLEHVNATQFGGYFEASIFDFFKRLYTYTTQFFTHQFTIYLVGFGLIGAFFLFLKQLRLFIFLSLILMVNILHSLFYNIPNIQDYYLPAFIIFSIWIGYGVANLIHLSTFFSLLLLLPIIPLIVHYHDNNRSQYYFATDLAKNILLPIEERPIIFLETDDTAYPIWYIHYVERRNPEAILIDVPFLAVHYDWYVRTLKEKHPDLVFTFKIQDMLGVKTKELERIRKDRIYNIIFNNINSHSIYKLYDSSMVGDYSLIPQGIFCKILEKDVSKEKLISQLNKNKKFLYRGGRLNNKRTQDLIARYPQTYYNIGSFYFGLKMSELAIEKFNQALEIDPKHLNARYGLGMAYKYSGMPHQAITNFKKILELEPNFAKAHYGIGYVHQEDGKILEAINAYKKALEIEPELDFVRTNLGVAYITQARLEEAIFEFKKAIELNPQNVNAYFNLGIAYTKNKDYQNAVASYQKVLQLAPNHQGALANLYSLKFLDI